MYEVCPWNLFRQNFRSLPLLSISSTNAPSMYFIGLCLSYCCWYGAGNRSNGTADFIHVFTVPKESAGMKSTRLRRRWIRLRVSNHLLIGNLNNSDISRQNMISTVTFLNGTRVSQRTWSFLDLEYWIAL